MQTVVGLLRHGQTDWNVGMRLQGISDIPLNDFGREQARTAGNVLVGQDWSRIVSSPLSRALETANIVASMKNIEQVEVFPILIERSFGIAEGMTYDEWRVQYPAGQHAKFSETLDDLDTRVMSILDTFLAEFSGTKVLTVSHGALIRRIIHLVSGGELPRDGERFGNASLTTIGHDGDSWKIINYNPAPLS